MYRDLPIEQLVRRADTRFQFGFANEARDLVPARDEFMLAPTRHGLRVLGRNEDSLQRPVAVLREVYGPRLEVHPPEVRLIGGVRLQEPIMHVRISINSRDLDAVKAALEKRGATPAEEYVRSSYAVLRYEAPLADLLGLGTELSQLADGSAKHWIVLSHYAVVDRDPGGKAA
jgi:predicted membrane GTPase involved in stress response